MTTIIASANQKGGVGKTALAVTLGHGAALQGKRVCIIDLDPQGNVSDSLGIPDGNDLVLWLDGRPVNPFPARPGLDVIRSDKLTASYKNTLAGRDYREYAIIEGLQAGYMAGYDLIILDCAPSVDVLHVAALTAANLLLIPTALDQFAIKGVAEILKSVTVVNRRKSDKTELAGIVPTFYDKNTNETQTQLENLITGFGSIVWPVIPRDSKIRYANRAGQTVWEYAPKCRAAAGYTLVMDRLLGLLP